MSHSEVAVGTKRNAFLSVHYNHSLKQGREGLLPNSANGSVCVCVYVCVCDTS